MPERVAQNPLSDRPFAIADAPVLIQSVELLFHDGGIGLGNDAFLDEHADMIVGADIGLGGVDDTLRLGEGIGVVETFQAASKHD